MSSEHARPVNERLAPTEEVALVTGAGGGMGRSIAARLAKDKFAVAVTDVDDQAATATAHEIHRSGALALAVQMDVTKAPSIEQALERIASVWGRDPAVLVNNAGIERTASLLEMQLADWEIVVSVNLTGVFLCTQLVARRMVSGGINGRIVNIASVNAEAVADAGLAAYASSKGGVRMLTKVSALELAQYGIRVNAVAPGITETNLVKSTLADEHRREEFRRRIPLGRLAKPDDIADVVAFLVSNDSRYMTGGVLFVEGGAVIGRMHSRIIS